MEVVKIALDISDLTVKPALLKNVQIVKESKTQLLSVLIHFINYFFSS